MRRGTYCPKTIIPLDSFPGRPIAANREMERFLKGLALTIGLVSIGVLALVGFFFWIPVLVAALILIVARLVVVGRRRLPESVVETESKKAA